VATPAEKQPALLSLTIPNTPTPENVTVPLFPSPIEEVAASAGTPVLEANADVTRTPNMADIRTPGALCRTPGLKRVQEVAGTLLEKERERSGNDMVFVEEPAAATDDDDEAEVSFGGGAEVANSDVATAAVDENNVGTLDVAHDNEAVGQDEVVKEAEIMDVCDNDKNELPVESAATNIDSSMQSENEQKDESMESRENDELSGDKSDTNAEQESEQEAMDVAEIPPVKCDKSDEQSDHNKFFESPNVVEKVVKPATSTVEKKDHHAREEAVSAPDQPTDKIEADVNVVLDGESKAPEDEDGNDSNQLFESCDEGEEKESGVDVKDVEQFSDAREEEVEAAALIEVRFKFSRFSLNPMIKRVIFDFCA
jgi:hypothetical protein